MLVSLICLLLPSLLNCIVFNTCYRFFLSNLHDLQRPVAVLVQCRGVVMRLSSQFTILLDLLDTVIMNNRKISASVSIQSRALNLVQEMH